MRRCTAWRSMYSDMSMRQMNDSSSNRNLARRLHTSVLPTPVGPRKRKEPSGRLCACRPAREMRTTLVMALMASSCPATVSRSLASMFRSFSRSPVMSCCTGMPVARATTWAMSMAVTESLTMNSPSRLACLSCSASLSSFGILSYWISEALAKSPSLVAISSWWRAMSISSVRRLMRSKRAFSRSQRSDMPRYSSSLVLMEFWIASTFSCDTESFSFLSASSSILRRRISRSSMSICSGRDSCCRRSRDAASSIRSIALSGSFRSDR
mmetsp:Transcript_5753/g.18083  ORF Transcript_5753/g.18083 Transcript_5753/m.18083 type:complete len:268 (+) Transcript_5753:914-1717(+)